MTWKSSKQINMYNINNRKITEIKILLDTILNFCIRLNSALEVSSVGFHLKEEK